MGMKNASILTSGTTEANDNNYVTGFMETVPNRTLGVMR